MKKYIAYDCLNFSSLKDEEGKTKFFTETYPDSDIEWIEVGKDTRLPAVSSLGYLMGYFKDDPAIRGHLQNIYNHIHND